MTMHPRVPAAGMPPVAYFAANLLALALAACLSVPGAARDVVVETAGGGINWTEGYIWADGYGAAPAEAPAHRKRLLARRAAQVDAYRNLAEFVKGVRVTSESVVRQMVLDSDIVRTKVDALIKGAVMVKDHYQNEVAQVTMRIDLDGDFSSTTHGELIRTGETAGYFPVWDGISPAAFKALRLAFGWFTAAAVAAETEEPLIRSSSDLEFVKRLLQEAERRQDPAALFQELEVNAADFEQRLSYTGLLIDARSVPEFELATVPRIRDPEGNIVYPSDTLLRQVLQARRPVSYDFSVEDAVRNARVSQRPRIVKARGVFRSRNSDLVISEQDAGFVIDNPRLQQVINRAGVMIVVAE